MASALLWAVPLFAQSDSIIHRDVEAVDVEAHRQKRQAVPMQTMSAVEIQQLGVQNLADAVRRFSGTNVKDYGGVGGLKTVSVRGLGAAHTAVSYDGVVVSDCQAGHIDIGRFDIGSIETIALTIGQPDGLLQSASAFAQAAMLSISTRKPNFTKRQTDANVRLKGGSFGYFDTQVEAARKVRHSTLSGTAQFMRSDGDYRYTIPNVDSTESGRRDNSDIRSARAEINLTTTDSSRFQNHLKAYGFYSERGLPGAVIFYYQQAKERLADKNFFVQNDCRLRLHDNLMLRFQAKYNYSWNRYEDTNVKYTNGRYVELNTQHEGYLSAAGLWSWRPIDVALAGDVIYNTLESDIKDNPQPRRLTLLSALNVRAVLQRFEATATLVARHASEKVEFGTRPDEMKRLTPALSLKWSSNRTTIRAMAKETYRVPTFNELYYTTLGTTMLKPEEARELNVGFDFGTDKFDFSADFYANDVDNKIVAIPTLYVWKMANYGKVKIWGADVAAGTEFDISEVRLKLTANYSYQKAIDVTDSNSKLYKSQIPYTPLHSGKAAAVATFGKYSLSATSIVSGKRYFLEYNIPDNEIEAYAEFSATATRHFDIGGSQLTASLSCLNITDNQYSVIKYYPMPGRQFQLQFNFFL